MKKSLKIILPVVIILIALFVGWFIFLRNPNIPVGEVIRDALPFGSGEDYNVSVLPGSGTGVGSEFGPGETFDEYATPALNLFRLSNTPVAGAVVFTRGGGPIVRYVDRATGHIYDVRLPVSTSTEEVLEKVKVSNTTIPQIYEAHFRPDGNAVLLRSLAENSDVVENLALILTPPTSVSTSSPQENLHEISSSILRGNIGSVAVGGPVQSATQNLLYYTLKDTSSIVSSPFSGSGVRTVFTSPFSDWRVSPYGSNLVIYSKASSNATGFAYSLNTSSGTISKILGPLTALTVTPNRAGTRLLYSYYDNGILKLLARSNQGETSGELYPATLAEKCVWSSSSQNIAYCGVPVGGVGSDEPDSWYRGFSHFSDRIWMFDTNAQIAEVKAEPEALLGVSIDAMDLKLSPNEDFLIFTNKNDLTLWALRLQ